MRHLMYIALLGALLLAAPLRAQSFGCEETFKLGDQEMAPFRFGPDDRWPDRQPIANHAKFWMVDSRIFYVGSDNMYPVNLQEFGYIVDDPKAAREVVDAYWTPLWQWSQRAAVSGRGVKNCIFREIIK